MIEFLTTYGLPILVAIIATEKAAQLIVKLTPTPKDDEWVAKIYRVLEWAAGLFRQKDVEPAADTNEDK